MLSECEEVSYTSTECDDFIRPNHTILSTTEVILHTQRQEE